MTFPGTYNINYYKGDTFEFRVYPKDGAGNIFPLESYLNENVKFTIANARGTGASFSLQCFSEISPDRTNILCAIRPQDSLLLTSNEYVYDVEIASSAEPYDKVYTLLTGSVSVTEQVTPPSSIVPPELQAPGPVSNVLVTETTQSQISVSWSAPTTGGAASSYSLYIVEYNPAFEGAGLATLISSLSLATPFTSTSTTFNFTQTVTTPLGAGVSLTPETAYVFAIVAVNAAGASSPVGNFNPTTGEISETFTYPNLPGPITGLTVDDVSSSSVSISWTAPSTGGTVEEYKMYILKLLPEYSDPLVLQAAIVATLAAGPIDTTENTEYTFLELEPETPYLVGVISSNIAGDSELVSNLGTPYVTDSEES